MTSTPQNPDGGDLLDFADAVNAGQSPQPRTDEERTYLHVHNALQGESAAIPPTTKQSTWEDVMSTLSLTPEAPVSNRTRKQRGISTPRFTPKRLQWTPLASIAAAALIIIASFGVWFTSGNESTPPPLAPQMAGISTNGDLAQIAATPEATAVVDEPGVRSIPIVQQVDEQPMDGPVIWITYTGDAMYDDGTEVTIIATNVQNIQPQATNVIKVVSDDPEKDSIAKDGREVEGYTVTYYNLLTGQTLVDDGTFSSWQGGPNTFGPLTVLTIADAPNLWSIVNFETMESKSIAELTGGQYRSSESITVAVSDDLSTIAIGTSQYESEASANLMKPSGMPGEIAVIPADLSGVNWVSVPEGMPAVGNVSLSPDGSKIAFISQNISDQGGKMTVSVVDVVTNEELTRTEQIDSAMIIHFQWLPTSDEFVVLSRESVQRFATDGSEPIMLLESEGAIDQMPNMTGSDMIYLRVSSVPLGMSTPEPDTTQLVILDPASGETIQIDGIPWFLGGSYPVMFSTSLAPIAVSQDGFIATLVHPITGEAYPELVANVDDPTRRPDFEPEEGQPFFNLQTVIPAQFAPVSAVELADGNLAAVRTSDDSFETQIIERPEGSEDAQINLSADGRYLIAGSSWNMEESDPVWVLDLSNDSPEWIQFAPNTTVFFADTSGE